MYAFKILYAYNAFKILEVKRYTKILIEAYLL